MTTIFYTDGKLYADSAVFKGADRLESLNKIVGLSTPLHIKCNRELQEKEKIEFDDIVHGWVGSGNYGCMKAFVKSLTDCPGDSEVTMAMYRLMAEAAVGVNDNVFEVIMIGQEANHSFSFCFNEFKYRQYKRDVGFAMGTGRDPVMQYHKAHSDPIRAMLEAFYVDECSGGMIDIWELLHITRDGEEHWKFRRQGIMEEVPREFIPQYLKDKGDEPIGMDFLRRSSVLAMMDDLLLEKQHKLQAKEPAAKKVVTKRVAAKKAVAKKAVIKKPLSSKDKK